MAYMIAECFVLISLFASQTTVKAEWQDSEKELSQLEAKEAAMIMAVLDSSVAEIQVKRKKPVLDVLHHQHVENYRGPGSQVYGLPIERCYENSKTGLTRNMLKQILNTGLSKNKLMFGEIRCTQNTFVTVDYGKSIYTQSGNTEHAEDNLFAKDESAIKNALKNGIWLNNSPCTRCAKTIMDKFKDIEQKPKIYVQNIYTGGGGLNNMVNSLKCLAKMMKKGFEISPWNWLRIVAKLTNKNCTKDITSAWRKKAFQEKMYTVLNTVDLLRHVNAQDEWCK